MNNEIILETKSLYKKINNKIILDKRSDIFYSNKIYLINGFSGSGKSTYLSCLANLNSYYGDIFYKNINLINLNENTYYLNEIGYVSQSPILSSYLKISEIIKLSFLNYSLKNKNYLFYEFEETIERLNIFHLNNSYEEELSGGEKYRVALALSLVGKKKIIILDEPTANLDKNNIDKIISLIQLYKSQYKTCFIIASHDQYIKYICDYIIDI